MVAQNQQPYGRRMTKRRGLFLTLLAFAACNSQGGCGPEEPGGPGSGPGSSNATKPVNAQTSPASAAPTRWKRELSALVLNSYFIAHVGVKRLVKGDCLGRQHGARRPGRMHRDGVLTHALTLRRMVRI